MGMLLNLAIIASGWLTPTEAVVISGEIAYYSQKKMAGVIEYRKVDLGEHLDGVALMPKADLGRTVWLELEGGRIIGPLLSVDCSREVHYKMNVARGRIMDLSWELWSALGLPNDLVAAKVWFVDPRVLRRRHFIPQ